MMGSRPRTVTSILKQDAEKAKRIAIGNFPSRHIPGFSREKLEEDIRYAKFLRDIVEAGSK